MSMNAADADRLRAQILDLDRQGLDKPDIVARLGCARSTVYKILADPGLDRRRHRAPSVAAIPPETVAEVRCLAAADETLSPSAIQAILTRRAEDGDRPV